ncbi:hypothetical protein GS597_02145 [Synechococcales cyanobacterium C]|uniref:Uncharacterized protein n=1 Tax=Petrachloros mirabilis ULC683 TaxID=2781853 RepID=A0A8K1ZWU5_9CYAN|nr:hypothetical protein [Petrachloros mirabilis]NCJ05333.1 hypothetical protein [Petrachloros mirabilis ULC683]
MASSRKINLLQLGWSRVVALLALLNLGLVFFDLTYLRARSFYLRQVPQLTSLYDPIKGIEPHPETQFYLEQVDALAAQVPQVGLADPEVTARLEELRSLSVQLLTNDPFAASGQSRTRGRIEREFRGRTRTPLAQEAVLRFWSENYLRGAGWTREITFFDREIRPLMAANYARSVNEYGEFVNEFWRIDAFFVWLFLLDFIARTYAISRRRPDLNWLEAMLRRWYDLPLFIPIWRWLRVLPTTLRLSQAKLLNLRPIMAQINHDVAVGFAQELTEMVGIQVINQLQQTVAKGSLAEWLFHPESRRPYVQIKGRNEAQVIASKLVNISVYEVLPQVQPEIADLIHHTITNTLNQAPLYRQFQLLPGIGQFPEQVTENLSVTLTQAISSSLAGMLEDSEGSERMGRLTQSFRQVLETELQKQQNIEEIQELLVDMLEEIKINYVENIAQRGMEEVVEEMEQLHRMTGAKILR